MTFAKIGSMFHSLEQPNPNRRREMAKAKKFITSISGKPGSGIAKTVFASGATSDDLGCAQFFMTMQDRGSALADAVAYAKIGPMLSPSVNWDEINRVLSTFSRRQIPQ